MSNKLRAGKVISHRINPKDCLSVIDLCEVAGIPTNNASFSMLVSLAFSSLLETARKNKIIPDRGGFEYLEMMQPFENRGQKQKLAFSDAIQGMGSTIHVPTVSVPMEFPRERVTVLPPFDPEGDIEFIRYKPRDQWTEEELKAELRRQKISLARQFGPVPENVQFAADQANARVSASRFTPEQREAQRDLKELIEKKKASLVNGDISWGSSDEERLNLLTQLSGLEDATHTD